MFSIKLLTAFSNMVIVCLILTIIPYDEKDFGHQTLAEEIISKPKTPPKN